MLNRKYAILGYACDLGAAHRGGRKAAEHLRQNRLFDLLKALGVEAADFGDATPAPLPPEELPPFSSGELQTHHLGEVYAACRALNRKTAEALEQGYQPLILGGDHSAPIGSFAALSDFYAAQNKRVGLIWVDAHSDINTPDTSPSMNIFGMSAAVLLGLMPGGLASLQKFRPAVLPHQLVYIGLRDIDPGEKEALRTLGITCFTMKEIDIAGIAAVTRQAIEIASTGTAGFALSFDIDACDPDLVPGTGTPKRGGITYREAHLLLELLYDSGKMLSTEIVELNPEMDPREETTEVVLSFIESAAGKSIL